MDFFHILFYFFVSGSIMYLKEIQSQCIGYHTETGKAHGSCTKHGVQCPSENRNPYTGCQWNTDHIVEECPEKILMDISQCCPA